MRHVRPPKDFDDDARAVWRAAQTELRLQGTWTDTTPPLLEMYVRAIRLAQRARVAAERVPFQRRLDGAAMIAHVELKVAENAEASALKLAQALLLTPESRKRHNVTVPTRNDDALARLVR